MGKKIKVYLPRPETIEKMKAIIRAEHIQEMMGRNAEPLRQPRKERMFHSTVEVPYEQVD